MNVRSVSLHLLLTGSLFLLTCTSEPEAPALPDQPNLIFLLADDLRWDGLGFSGPDLLRTPAIDSLAARGTVFRNAYVTTSICSVSRASILSGQYARRHEKWGFGPGFGPDEWDRTYPAQLKAAGYRTGFIGKYGVGAYQFASQQFDYWRGFPGQGSFKATDEVGNDIHLTRLMGQQAEQFIRTSEGEPFALSVSFKAPHAENEQIHWSFYDPAYEEVYEGAYFPQPRAAEVEHFDHFPPVFTEGNEARKRYRLRMGDATLAQESLEGYNRLIYGLDRAVSRIVQTLREEDQLENTIIILTSDNGMYLGEYGFSGKWYGSDPSIRVPLIVVDPSVAEPRALNEIVLNIDVAPTLLDYAGLPVPETMQGRSMRSLVQKGTAANWRSDFLYEHLWDSGTGYYIPSTEGVVSDSVKYMRYFRNFDPADLVFEELYRTANDPDELNNLIDQEASLKSSQEARLNLLIEQSK